MVWDEDRGRGGRIAGTVILLIMLALLGGILYLRFFATDSVKLVTDQGQPLAESMPTDQPQEKELEEIAAPSEEPSAVAQAVEQAAPEETAEPTDVSAESPETAEEPSETPEPAAEATEVAAEPAEQPTETTEAPAAQTETAEKPSAQTETPADPAEAEYRPIHYDDRSFKLVTDMVFAYKKQPANMNEIIAADVAALKEHDQRLGDAWGGIMDYWAYANNDMEILTEKLPDDLPNDDSLCIVVLGFELKRDGTMKKEMEERCKLALSAAEQYPNAYILLSGGGTAKNKPEATEAGVMADWFKEQGVSADRLILEDESLTTDQNASKSLALLVKDYPQVKHLVIVSSDYHLPMSCLLFTAASLMYGAEYGKPAYDVVSNLGYHAKGLEEYTLPSGQGLYLWALTHPGT